MIPSASGPRAKEAGRHELVIAMTLAELFLLILLVVWWGFAKEADAAGRDPATVSVARMQEELKALRREITQVKRDATRVRELEALLAQYEQIVKYLRRSLSVTSESLDPAVWDAAVRAHDRNVAEIAKRGFPRCVEGGNTLVQIRVVNGINRVAIASAGIEMVASDQPIGRIWKMGEVLESELEIRTLLEAVSAYYRGRADKPCRFDYRLEWGSDNDYRYARERFEAAFYPAGISRVANQ